MFKEVWYPRAAEMLPINSHVFELVRPYIELTKPDESPPIEYNLYSGELEATIEWAFKFLIGVCAILTHESEATARDSTVSSLLRPPTTMISALPPLVDGIVVHP